MPAGGKGSMVAGSANRVNQKRLSRVHNSQSARSYWQRRLCKVFVFAPLQNSVSKFSYCVQCVFVSFDSSEFWLFCFCQLSLLCFGFVFYVLRKDIAFVAKIRFFFGAFF